MCTPYREESHCPLSTCLERNDIKLAWSCDMLPHQTHATLCWPAEGTWCHLCVAPVCCIATRGLHAGCMQHSDDRVTTWLCTQSISCGQHCLAGGRARNSKQDCSSMHPWGFDRSPARSRPELAREHWVRHPPTSCWRALEC